MATYTLVYHVLCRNRSQTDMALAWAGVALPHDFEQAGGLVLSSDTTAPVGTQDVDRTIVYTSTPGTPSADPRFADALTGCYTTLFARALSCPVRPDPVGVT